MRVPIVTTTDPKSFATIDVVDFLEIMVDEGITSYEQASILLERYGLVDEPDALEQFIADISTEELN